MGRSRAMIPSKGGSLPWLHVISFHRGSFVGLICSVLMTSTHRCDVERSDKQKPGRAGMRMQVANLPQACAIPRTFRPYSRSRGLRRAFGMSLRHGQMSQFENPALTQSGLHTRLTHLAKGLIEGQSLNQMRAFPMRALSQRDTGQKIYTISHGLHILPLLILCLTRIRPPWFRRSFEAAKAQISQGTSKSGAQARARRRRPQTLSRRRCP